MPLIRNEPRTIRQALLTSLLWCCKNKKKTSLVTEWLRAGYPNAFRRLRDFPSGERVLI